MSRGGCPCRQRTLTDDHSPGNQIRATKSRMRKDGRVHRWTRPSFMRLDGTRSAEADVRVEGVALREAVGLHARDRQREPGECARPPARNLCRAGVVIPTWRDTDRSWLPSTWSRASSHHHHHRLAQHLRRAMAPPARRRSSPGAVIPSWRNTGRNCAPSTGERARSRIRWRREGRLLPVDRALPVREFLHLRGPSSPLMVG